MPNLIQPTLFDHFDSSFFSKSKEVLEAVENMALSSDIDKRGAVFTKIEVVDFILDLVEYTTKRPLYSQRILEPSFGDGDFLLPLVDRLLSSWRGRQRETQSVIEELGGTIRAVELHKDTFESTRKAVIRRLKDEGLSDSSATELADHWLIQGDFLLEELDNQFDYIVGNPPYVRQELIPSQLLDEYRCRYSTMYDRADLYIPFIERALSLLCKGGVLGFICSDRWIKNRYGGPLRNFMAQGFHLKAYVDMVDTSAFHTEVSVYPAITIVSKEKAAATRIAHRPKIDKKVLKSVAKEIMLETLPENSFVSELNCVANGEEPWLLESSDQMEMIRRIEKQYVTIEQAGCKVGIGVATGADKVFIGDFDSLDVEPDRKLPLATTRDIRSGEVVWRRQGVINPFAKDGKLVDLASYPRLACYLEAHKEVITKRHCARKAPSNWYRTIDRIWPALSKKPKLLIPDIKGDAHIVFESGKLYPHHNLYYVTSQIWDLRALQAVLLSSVTKLFVETYSTKMRGGYLRFQAQYLRRIRIPLWQNVTDDLRKKLIQAAKLRDLDACNKAAFDLYKLDQDERYALGSNGE